MTMTESGQRDRRAVNEEQFREWTRPRLMLFLSADIENSTRLKQRNRRDPGDWLKKVFPFISRFPTEFQSMREMRAVAGEWEVPAPENAWKVLGDEVIFAIEIRDRLQPEREVSAFARVLEQWNEGDTGTILKGAVWMAGFPVSNKIIPVLTASDRLEPDYIGPSMDAGFRLSKDATSRRLILSVETAWWIINEYTEQGTPGDLKIHFQGCSPHKGLAEETGYPLIWTGIREPRFQRHEDTLLGRCSIGNAAVLRDLCRDFIEEFGVPGHLPFLLREGNQTALSVNGRPFHELLVEARDLMRQVLLEEGPSETAEPANGEEITSDELREKLLKSLGEIPGQKQADL